MRDVGILIVDDNPVSQSALRHILGAEGWRVLTVTRPPEALSALATGAWSLAIVNVTVTGLGGPLYTTLRELSKVEIHRPATPDSTAAQVPRKCLRALFLIPSNAPREFQLVLEQEGLPYAIQPYRLDDFLGRISDLLLETGALTEPIRSDGFGKDPRGPRRKRKKVDHRHQMFASRADYQMTEEEIVEFERQEEEERKKRGKGKKDPEQYY